MRHHLACPSRIGARFAPALQVLLVALTVACAAAPAHAQFNMGVKIDVTAGTSPYMTAIGDLNADGNPDLVVANNGSSTISVFLGNGAGGFGARTDFATGASPISVVLADLNGDGRLDAATANYGSGSVSVLLGNGAGGFAPKADLAAGAGANFVVVGDVNKDGRPDLVVTNTNAYTVSVLLGAPGGFAPKTDYPTGAIPYVVAIGDVNADGVTDLVVTNDFENTVSVYFGNGVGGFSPRVSYATGTGPTGVGITDLNGDGRPDLVVANGQSSTVSVFLGTGGGAFAAKVDYPATGTPWSVALGDVTGDGKTDVVVGNSNSSNASVFAGTGTGTLSPRVDYAIGSPQFSIAIGDINRDGKPDLVTANHVSGTASVLFGRGTGAFAPKVDYVTGGTAPACVATGDLNGDGKLDMAVGNASTNTLSVYLGNGAGGFGPRADYATLLTPISVGMTDYNSDGKLDVVVVNENSGAVSLFPGNGTGALGVRADMGGLASPIGLAVGDVNNDGRADIVVTESGTGKIAVYLQQVIGIAPPVEYLVGTFPYAVAIGDLNADGKPDLAVANYTSGNISVLFNAGAGTFGIAGAYGSLSSPISVAIGDLNGDGRTDLVATSYLGNTVVPLLQTNTGAFAVSNPMTTLASPVAVAIGDLNGDGRPDLAVADEGSAALSVFLNNGAGGFVLGFGPRADYPTGTTPESVALADFNGDGRLDVLVPDYGASTVSVLLALQTSRVSLAIGPGPVTWGPPILLTATVTVPAPQYAPASGTVSFFDGPALIGTAPVNGGVAALFTTGTLRGDHICTAVYSGDSRLLGATSAPVAARFVDTSVPFVMSIKDIANDQGRSVRLTFSGSGFDYLGSATPVVRYDVFRRIAPGLAPATAARPVPASPDQAQVAGWDLVGSSDATTDGLYSLVVPTLADSNATGLHRATLFVRALTASPGLFFDSPPDSGYSVDNLPPLPPSPFTAAYAAGATHLHWGKDSEPDLWYYRVYRGSSAAFVPAPGNLIASSADTGYVDVGVPGSYYKLSAVDVNGNESAYALLTPSGTTDVGAGPAAFALARLPNPLSGGRLTVTFELPSAESATLEMVDVGGRQVALRAVGTLGAGRHSVTLGEGEPLAAGLYFVRLTQGAHRAMGRVTVLR